MAFTVYVNLKLKKYLPAGLQLVKEHLSPTAAQFEPWDAEISVRNRQKIVVFQNVSTGYIFCMKMPRQDLLFVDTEHPTDAEYDEFRRQFSTDFKASLLTALQLSGISRDIAEAYVSQETPVEFAAFRSPISQSASRLREVVRYLESKTDKNHGIEDLLTPVFNTSDRIFADGSKAENPAKAMALHVGMSQDTLTPRIIGNGKELVCSEPSDKK